MKHPLAFILFGLAFAAGAADARAQLPATRAPAPPVSPYLNLLRPGTNPAINYYDLVRPQIDFRNSIQGLQQQLNTQQQTVSTLETAAAAPTTGHASRFLNTGGYFMRLGSQSPAAFGAPATSPTRSLPATPAPARR